MVVIDIAVRAMYPLYRAQAFAEIGMKYAMMVIVHHSKSTVAHTFHEIKTRTPRTADIVNVGIVTPIALIQHHIWCYRDLLSTTGLPPTTIVPPCTLERAKWFIEVIFAVEDYVPIFYTF